MKHSKSKFKRTSMDHSELPLLIAKPLLEPLPACASIDPYMGFDSSQSFILAIENDNVGSNLLSGMDTDLPMERESLEAVPHHYVPGFISGLDDCPLLPEYTDIG